VVTREDLIVEVSRVLHEAGLDKVTQVVVGGETRTVSVMIGLDCVSKKTKLAAIHDGARPFVTTDLIERTVRAAAESGAAAPAVPVKDTIKVAHQGIVTETPDRSTLFAVQTPQVFDFDLLRGAMVKAEADGLTATDDCAIVEHLGMSVRLTEGDEENIKLTTPLDLALAQAIAEGRNG
jgi:2-C-methyl-D-erythritol 4-phosphate cytidylyltransferase